MEQMQRVDELNEHVAELRAKNNTLEMVCSAQWKRNVMLSARNRDLKQYLETIEQTVMVQKTEDSATSSTSSSKKAGGAAAGGAYRPSKEEKRRSRHKGQWQSEWGTLIGTLASDFTTFRTSQLMLLSYARPFVKYVVDTVDIHFKDVELLYHTVSFVADKLSGEAKAVLHEDNLKPHSFNSPGLAPLFIFL